MSAEPITIGLDFDNTLVCYDQLFYDLAQEHTVLPESVAATKTAVRDFFRTDNREPEWTALQGLAYGLRIVEAQPFEHLVTCLKDWEQQGHELLIVSHKTCKPYAGPAYDLHAAAHQWLQTHLLNAGVRLLGGVYLEESRALKLARIANLEPAIYIDDLPDIISDLDLKMTRGVLFDPHGLYHGDLAATRVFHNWSQVQHLW